LFEKLDYFDRFFNQEHRVHAHDINTDAETFRLLLKRVYGASLELPAPTTDEEANPTNEAIAQLIKSCGLTDLLFKDDALVDAVFTTMYGIFRHSGPPTFNEIRLTSNVTALDSPDPGFGYLWQGRLCGC
jgi:hypothetical protein